MTDVVSPLTWKMTLDTGGFEVAATRAGQVLRSLTGSFDQSTAAAARAEHGFHKVGASFKSVVVTLGALRFALMDLDDFLLSFPKSVAKAGGEFERMQVLMQGLSKETDEVMKKMDAARGVMSIISLSKSAPFEVKALSDAFVKLKTAGIDPTNGSLQALVDSVAKVGGSSDQLKRASVAIQQMMGKGVISMEEMRQQLAEAVPNAMELMARGMGMSIADLTAKISKGSVKSSAALARMFLQMQLDAAGAAEKMMKTMPGALERLTTEYQLFQKTVSNQGFLTTLTAAFGEITTMLESPAGQEFAKSIGVALREVTESFIVMGRWITENTTLLKWMGIVLTSIYGGSKIASMIDGIRGRMRMLAEEQMRTARIAQATAEREIAQLQRVANAKERAIGQIERRKEAYEKRLEAQRDSQVKALDKQIAGETTKLQGLETRRLELLDKRAAAEMKAVERNAKAVEASRAKIRDGFSKVADLTDKKGTVLKDADAGLQSRQKALESQRLSAIDRLNAKNIEAVEKLKALEQRRDDAVATQKQAAAERLARLADQRADREGKLASKMAGAQERLVQLEEKRARLVESTRNNAIQKLEKEARDNQTRLAGMNAKIQEVSGATLTDTQKTTQLADLRKLETEKRTAHERELARIEQVRATRVKLEREQLEAQRKLEERKAGPQRDESGRFIKGGSKADLARMEAENVTRARAIEATRIEETAHRANARALQEEGKAAAQAGDALSKRSVGADASLGVLKQEAAAIERKLVTNAQEIASIRAKTAQEIAANGPAAQRLAGIDQQIAKQRQLMDVHAQERVTLEARAVAANAALSTSSAQVQAFEREIATKQRSIATATAEVQRLQATTIEKGKYSAATDAKVAALNREIASTTQSINSENTKLQAARAANAVHAESVQAIDKQTAANTRNIETVKSSTAAMQVQAQTLRAKVVSTDQHVQALGRESAALQASLAGTNANIAAKGQLVSVVTRGGSALLGFGKSLLAGVGWALAFGVAIEGATWLIGQFTKAARDAEAAQQRLTRARNGQSVEGDELGLAEDSKKASAEVDSLEAQIAQLKKKRENAGKTISYGAGELKATPEDKFMVDRQVAIYDKQIEDLQNKANNLRVTLVDLNEKQKSASLTVSANKVETVTGSIMQNLEKQSTKQLNELATFGKDKSQTLSALNLQNKLALAAEYKKGNAADPTTVAALLKEGADIGRMRIEAEVKILAETRKGIMEAHANDSAEQKASLKAALDAKEAGLAEMQFNALDSFDAKSKKDKKPKKAYVRPDSTYDNFIQAKKAELAKLQADATMFEDGIVSVADIYNAARTKFESAVKSGEMTQTDAKGKKREITVPEKDAAIKFMAEEQIGKNIDNFRSKLLPALDALKAQQEQYSDVLNGDALIKPSKEVRAMDKIVQELARFKDLLNTPQGLAMAKAIGVTREEIDALTSSASKLRQMPASIALLENMDEQNKSIKGLQDDQVTDDRERQRIITANRIAEETRRTAVAIAGVAATGTLEGERLQQVLESSRRLGIIIELEQQRLKLLTQSAAQTMADEWGRGMQNLDSASVGWMNTFTDQLFEGKLAVKEFATSVLKDIAKIKFKQVMSEGIGGAMDIAVKGVGDFLGLKTSATGSQALPIVGGAMLVRNIDAATAAVAGSLGVDKMLGSIDLGMGNVFKSMNTSMDSMFAGMKIDMGSVFSGLDLGMGNLLNTLPSLFSGISLGGGGGLGAIPEFASMAFGASFANGGIMTGAGEVSLRKYANGGVANKPQLALFGEGSRPEAYVPLPDGRRIPVALQGGETEQAPAGEGSSAPVVNVNVINQTGTQASAKVGNMRFDGRQMILDVVLTAASQPGGFRDNFRNAVNQK